MRSRKRSTEGEAHGKKSSQTAAETGTPRRQTQGEEAPPHPDYHKAKVLFGDVDLAECKEEFEFGKDGKPLYISGPFESARRSQEIVNTLTHRCGPDGFHFLIGMQPSAALVPGEEDEDL